MRELSLRIVCFEQNSVALLEYQAEVLLYFETHYICSQARRDTCE
jgi:hypothetical protein